MQALRRYHAAYVQWRHASLASSEAAAAERSRAELAQLEALMARVEQTVRRHARTATTAAATATATTTAPPPACGGAQVLASHAEKNTEIILLSEQLMRRLGGVRITSCKSAKDRTSMAVTAEQARLLMDRHGLHEEEAAELADEMRRYGVRWQNMRKNVSGGQYAFNWLQQRLLPEIYRAPTGTYKRFGGTAT